ncbi:MAG TPA: prepilin-type N-terminal cleavage/methylation domain-containing protein [Patescibacteria group bacterium]|nr:prepilin-type N-terminal cleavage/methylation domain-containing protein [Patescibacteria group bacterium]
MITKKIKKDNRGYTVAELMAVLSILVIISGIVVSIIYSTLRGQSKTRVTTDVSQNGEYASSVISGIIADSRNVEQINGQNFDDCTGNPSSATITPAPDSKAPSITLKRISGDRTIIACEQIGGINGYYTITSNSAALINNALVKVDKNSCVFSCSQTVSDPYSIPLVNFSFSISQYGDNVLFERQSSAAFSSSASLRVYSP